MLSKIIAFSVRNKLIVGLATLGLILYGAFETTRLPIDAVPDITDNQVQVITVAPSFGATDIERLITFPVEQANNNLPGLKEIRSFSRFGLSVVTIVFDDATDVYWARQQVAERLQNVQKEIPEGMGTPELGPVTTGLGEIYQYVLRPAKGYEQKYDAMEMRTIQDWLVRRQLLGVQGVAEVSSFGGRLKQYEIALNSNRLQALGVTLSEVYDAVQRANQNTGGAYIEKGPTTLFIRTEGLIESLDDIRRIAIKQTEQGLPVFLQDVAEVRFGSATRYGALCYNDEGEVAGGIVMMLKNANSNDVIGRVRERIVQIRKTLPKGVIIEPFLDRTKMVNNAIGTVEKNLLEGALIVVFVLVLFLGNFRAGLLVASVIPLSMLFAIILMNTFGVSGNLMSLGALDFGLIVDGAVIIVEAVLHQVMHGRWRQQSERLAAGEMDGQVKAAAGKMMNSAVFGQIIILVVYLPIFTLHGIEGKMFKPMAETVAFALLGAFILSLTYVPMMSAWLLRGAANKKPGFSERMLDKISKGYQHWLRKLLPHPKMVLGSMLVLFVLSLWLMSNLGGEFIPALEEGDFAVETRFLTGSNLNTSISETSKCAAILKKRFPEVQKVVTKIGSGEVPTDPMPMEACDMMIILDDKENWKSAETFDELAEKMTQALEDVPGVSTSFQYPVQMRFNELMTGARQDVVCKIFGENLDTLAAYAAQLGDVVRKIPGTQGVYVEAVNGLPQIVVRYNREALARYGLHIRDVNQLVNAAFAGQVAGQVYEGERRFDLVLRLQSDDRRDLDDVRQLLLPLADGSRIPLAQVAEVDLKIGPNQVQREDAKRRIIVGFNVRGRDVQSVVEDVQQAVDQHMKFDSGYYITYGGTFENLREANARLMIAVPVSLLLIFLLLYFAFGSIKQGLLIYSAIPLSAIGGIFFLYLRDMPFSISAGVGFIALFGISVLNGIVLIAEFNRLRKQGLENMTRIILTGTRLRLRPVLMTASVASLGFLPMALSDGAGAEVQRPLATVVIGGLLIATLLTLFVLPMLYMLFNRTEAKSGSKKIMPVLLVLIGLSGSGFSQQGIDISQALALAESHNLEIRSSQFRTEAGQALKATSRELAPTQVVNQLGQINSVYTDHQVSLGQSFRLPGYYRRRSEWYQAQINIEQSDQQLRVEELKREVRKTFYHYLLLSEKEQVLLGADSLYQRMLERIDLRLQQGAGNVLEKANAQTQRSSIALQLQQLRQDQEAVLAHFNWLLNAGATYLPQSNAKRLEASSVADTAQLNQHVFLKTLDQRIRATEQDHKLQRSVSWPEISVMYNNMTMRGSGADNVVYDYGKRFQSVQIGLNVPLFTAQKSKLKALQLVTDEARFRYEQENLHLKQLYRFAQFRYGQNLQNLQLMERDLLPALATMIVAADQQLANGEISYLEWGLLITQALQARMTYLDSLDALNDSAAEWLFYQMK